MFIENIEKNALLKPLQSVIGVVERKQPLPILSNVLIEKNEAGMRFVTTDLEIQIATQFDSENSLGDQSAITVSAKKFQEILRVPIIGVVPESESVLHASNQGTPAVHLEGSDVSEAYKDVVARFLGEEKPLRFIDAEKPGFFKRLFGGR